MKIELYSKYTNGSDYRGKIKISKKLIAYIIFRILTSIILIILLFLIVFKLYKG